MDDFNRKRHAVYKLTYHAVFVIKYRRKVMSEPIIDHVRQYAAHLIEQCYQGRLIELNGELKIYQKANKKRVRKRLILDID